MINSKQLPSTGTGMAAERFGDPQITAMFSVEAALAQVQAALGIIPSGRSNAHRVGPPKLSRNRYELVSDGTEL